MGRPQPTLPLHPPVLMSSSVIAAAAVALCGATGVAAAEYSPYSPPLPMSLYSMLAIVLLVGGIASTLSFLGYEVTSNKVSRSIQKEATMALTASGLLGFGVLFLLLWVGVYV